MKKIIALFLSAILVTACGSSKTISKVESPKVVSKEEVITNFKTATKEMKFYTVDFKLETNLRGENSKVNYKGSYVQSPESIQFDLKVAGKEADFELPVYLVENYVYSKVGENWFKAKAELPNSIQMIDGFKNATSTGIFEVLDSAKDIVEIKEEGDKVLIFANEKKIKNGKLFALFTNDESKDIEVNKFKFELNKQDYTPISIEIDIKDKEDSVRFDINYENVNKEIKIELPEEAKAASEVNN